MNIEIADKLVKLRKQNGYSQEELADKLGLSRQAVSKWERAEASPDTDNLICLAKLYNISLDELLSTEDDVETIVKEQVKSEEKEDKAGIHFENDSIRAVDDDGSEVVIDGKGFHAHDKDGNSYDWNDPVRKRRRHIYMLISGIGMSIALLTYILLGALCNMWSTMWILFFVPDIIASIYKCFANKEAHSFNMAFLSIFTFFLVCWVLLPEQNLWHPMWVVFLAIPVYHGLTARIEAVINDHKKIEEETDNNIDEEAK